MFEYSSLFLRYILVLILFSEIFIIYDIITTFRCKNNQFTKMDDTDFKAAMPKTVLSFYVKLYCKKRKLAKGKVKKKTGHTALMEATKSWLSLSKKEKDVIIEKYNIARAEYNKKVGEYLKNAEPYLKKRDPAQSKTSLVPQNNSNQDEELTINLNNVGLESVSNGIAPITEPPSLYENMTSEIHGANRQQVPNINEHCTINTSIRESLPEPTPPTLTSAKDLFEMLTKNGDNCATWESLTSTEKRRYQSAVLSIKRSYITSYKKFLESLTREELYKHYVNNKETNIT